MRACDDLRLLLERGQDALPEGISLWKCGGIAPIGYLDMVKGEIVFEEYSPAGNLTGAMFCYLVAKDPNNPPFGMIATPVRFEPGEQLEQDPVTDRMRKVADELLRFIGGTIHLEQIRLFTSDGAEKWLLRLYERIAGVWMIQKVEVCD